MLWVSFSASCQVMALSPPGNLHVTHSRGSAYTGLVDMMGMPTHHRGTNRVVRRSSVWTTIRRPHRLWVRPPRIHLRSTPATRLRICGDRTLSTVSTAPMTTTKLLIPLEIRPTSLANGPACRSNIHHNTSAGWPLPKLRANVILHVFRIYRREPTTRE